MISLTIPETITSVGVDAFPTPYSYSTNTTNTTTDFFLYYEGTIEQWCRIEFADRTSNPFYMSKDMNTKFYCDGELITGGDLIIPDGITSISHSFYHLTLNSVTIPASVTEIAPYSFYGTNLNYAYFEVTTGWEAGSKSQTGVTSWKSVSSSKLADPQTAAGILSNNTAGSYGTGYAGSTWTRS